VQSQPDFSALAQKMMQSLSMYMYNFRIQGFNLTPAKHFARVAEYIFNSNIPTSPANGVQISQLIRYARAYSTYDLLVFFILETSLCPFSLVYSQRSANFMVVTTI
jgi:hypothetical protein